MNDNELEKRLAEWKPELPGHPNFQREVWRRIEHQKSKGLVRSLNGMFSSLTRPVIGLPTAALVIACSAALATYQGTKERDDTWSGLAMSYGQSIDPNSHIK